MKTKPRGGASLVAAGILLSRLAGLVREHLFSRYFGLTPLADALVAALRVPNLLAVLFGEGVLSASFIPVYANLIARERRDEAGRVAGAVFVILALFTAVLVALGVAATPWIIPFVASGFDEERRRLAIPLVRIFFPMSGLLVMSAWCLGILNSHRKFFLSYSVPVLWNMAMIAAMIVFGKRVDMYRLSTIFAWSAVVGSAIQFLAQLPFVLSLVPGLRLGLATELESVRTVVRNFVPVFFSRGVVQLSAFIDTWLASFLGVGAMTALAKAQLLYLLPVSLFGMSVSASELPEMSSATGGEGDIAAFLVKRLTSGLQRISMFVIPSVVAFIALGDIVSGAVLQGGKFTAADTRYVWTILAGSGIGLLASTQGRLYSSAFYALKDTRTPLRFAIIRVILTTVLGYICALPLHFGAPGLTATAGVSGWIEFLLLRHTLSKRIGTPHVGVKLLVRLWGAAIFAAAVGWAIKLKLPVHEPRLAAVEILIPFGAIYLLLVATSETASGTRLLRLR